MKRMFFSIVAAYLAMQLSADTTPVFDWTPNNAPTGTWFTSWKNEANDVTTAMTGPDGTTTNLYAVTASGTTWSPYNSDAVAKSDYTLSFYGSVENVTAGSGGPAVLWCMGKSANGGMTMLVKDSSSHLILVSVPNGARTASRTIDAGLAPNGFHLFTVRFSTTNGASVQIDDGEIVADTEFTSVSGNGLQIGSPLGGTGTVSFSRGAGFAVLRMVAFDTAALSDEDFNRTFAAYLPGRCATTSTYDGGTWTTPQDSRMVYGHVMGLSVGTNGVVQTLGFNGTNAVVASVLCELPEGAEGALVGVVDVKGASEHKIYAYANGNGTFTIYYDTKQTTAASVSSGVLDVSGVHLWTLAFETMNGAKLYLDGTEIASDSRIKWTGNSLHLISKEVSFGSATGATYPITGMKIYAVDTDFGPDNSTAASVASAASRVFESFDFLADYAGESVESQLAAFARYMETGYTTTEVTHECVLRVSEILPKPTDALTLNGMEGMDVNGLESGWVEVENTSDKWADLADYRFIRVNRGKKTDPAGFGNFPSRLVPPRGRAIFYTSERYANSKDMTVSAWATPDPDGNVPKIYADFNNVLVWPDKVNPKKSPYVRLYYAPVSNASNIVSVVDTVVIPSDLPEGWSIIVGEAAEGEGTRRWMCPTPTRGRANTATAGLTRIGPNVGPLYEKKGQKKTDFANEFAVPTPPAVPGEDYTVTLPINPVMNPAGTFTPRTTDQITSIKFVYRKDLDNSTLVTTNIDMLAKTTVENWGDQYTATIPANYFPERGHLMQWKVLITDGEGVEWTSPSFNNKDDGYEWYGTIVEPDPATQMSATLPTWHLFASGNHLSQMDVDVDKQNLSLVPYNARIAIYDSSTSNYYDYVRIDLRGNTSAKFTKKGHGLRFAKAHPLTMTDVVTGEPIEEIRKTSLISEFADPSFMRQMTAFWLWRKMGNLVPFDFPVRCNLNGEFYQLAYNSERFTDELIEDVYGLDKFGYGYKNVGTMKSGTSTTAGSIEKKTPDDEDETNITVLENELRKHLKNYGAQSGNEDIPGLTKFVVQKFDLPAWLNYLASARITQEMDDVWANVCAYYENPDMKEGTRGRGTWMPLGYDFNISFGQYYYNDIKNYGNSRNGLMATNDWFKSHPFYGGNKVVAYRNSTMADAMSGNDGFESVLQNAKFRRLYLRRLRTLMDQELKEPGTPESEVPFMAKMREMANLMRDDSELDQDKWPNDTSDDAIDVWPSGQRPPTIDAGIDEIWNDYVVPRREHLYVTHSVTNTAKAIGYGSNLNAGIPEAQSPISALAPNITVANMTALGAEESALLGVAGQFYNTEVIEIANGNAEAVDMSGWRIAYSVDFTLPPGTVCDANDSIFVVADRRAYIAAHDTELTDQVIVGNATFTGAGPVAIFAADGTQVFAAIPDTNEKKFLRLDSFCGNTNDGADGDTGEWFTLTNISDSATLDLAGVTVCFLKQGDPEAENTHCHVTLENKKGKGDVKPLKSWMANQADYAGKGWLKIQNNKQQITIYDKYGSVCQSLKVTQKDFPLAYGAGGWLVCDSQAATVTAGADWHQETNLVVGEGSGVFDAKSQAKADEVAAAVAITLTAEDIAAGLSTESLVVVAKPVEGQSGKYVAVVVPNPTTVADPQFAVAGAGGGDDAEKPISVEQDETGNTILVSTITNAVLGLWYGYEVSNNLGGGVAFTNDVDSFQRATNATFRIEASSRAAPSGFYRVKAAAAKPVQ